MTSSGFISDFLAGQAFCVYKYREVELVHIKNKNN
jgi:hypothetical protein